jgi:hypothetical protein
MQLLLWKMIHLPQIVSRVQTWRSSKYSRFFSFYSGWTKHYFFMKYSRTKIVKLMPFLKHIQSSKTVAFHCQYFVNNFHCAMLYFTVELWWWQHLNYFYWFQSRNARLGWWYRKEPCLVGAHIVQLMLLHWCFMLNSFVGTLASHNACVKLLPLRAECRRVFAPPLCLINELR